MIDMEQMALVLDGQMYVVPKIGVHVVFSFDVVKPEPNVPVIQILRQPVDKQSTLSPRKRNKIINNSYKSGDNLKGDDYRFDTVLKVESGYASSNLGHIYDVENNMIYKKVQNEIIGLIGVNAELQKMLDDATPRKSDDVKKSSDVKPKKFNREKINRMFRLINAHFEKTPATLQFSNLIYIFDNVSNLSGLKYASLYELLDGDLKQRLLLELDKKYDILKNSGKSNSLF